MTRLCCERCEAGGNASFPALNKEEAVQEVLCMCRHFQSTAMKWVAGSLVLLTLLRYHAEGVHIRNLNFNASDVPDAAVVVDLSAVIHRVDQRFLSVTIDASLAADEKFMYLLGWVSVGGHKTML